MTRPNVLWKTPLGKETRLYPFVYIPKSAGEYRFPIIMGEILLYTVSNKLETNNLDEKENKDKKDFLEKESKGLHFDMNQ